MDLQLDDQDVIFNAYKKYPAYARDKSSGITNKNKLISLQGEMFTRLARILFVLNSSASLESEKDAAVEKTKKLYRQMTAEEKANPGFMNKKLADKMDEALQLSAGHEAMMMFYVRNRMDEPVCLEQYLDIPENICRLLKNPVGKLSFEDFVSEKGKHKKTVYITAKGRKYHKPGCFYCREKKMEEIPLSDARKKGLLPCRCVTLHEDRRILDITAEYVTVFIDESVRRNPWAETKQEAEERHGVYSYIICSGLLESENEILEMNEVCSSVEMIPDARKTNEVAIEAISAAIFRLLTVGYTGNVMVYTDNLNASMKWKEAKIIQILSTVFSSIHVKYIPREQNKRADKLNRSRVFLDVSSGFARSVLNKCSRYDQIKKIMSDSLQECDEPD